MPPRMSAYLRASFADGTYDASTSTLDALPYIGPYLEGRLRRAVRSAAPLTMQSFVRSMGRIGTERVVRIVQRAMQNERSNQCVSPSRGGADRTYHAGDVNEYGYESILSLLDVAKEDGLYPGSNLRYSTPLPRLRARSPSSRACGCRSAEQGCGSGCVASGGRCVPRNNRSPGFSSPSPHPNQSESARTSAERQSVRRRARTPLTAATMQDPDAARDAGAHPASMTYTTRGRRMWRDAGPRRRLPIERR